MYYIPLNYTSNTNMQVMLQKNRFVKISEANSYFLETKSTIFSQSI